MTRPCSSWFRHRSEPSARRRPAVAAALAAVVVVGAATPAAPATVSGTVEVARATVRTEGPKHDRDVVLLLKPLATTRVAPSRARASMDQRGLVFLPHVLAVQKGTTVTFLNSDNDQHNVYFLDDATGETLDIGTWGPGVSVDHTFETPGLVITLCKLHLEMAAYILVVEGPWFTVADLGDAGTAGGFSIDGVPPGEYELVAWHKKLRQLGGPARVTVPESGASGIEVVITPARYAKG